MSNRFFGALVALLMTLFVAFPAKGQIIDDEYNPADLAAGVTAYSGPLNGMVDIDAFLRKQGVADFNWDAIVPLRMRQTFWCSTKMRLSDLVPQPIVEAMGEYRVICRDTFTGSQRNLRMMLGPVVQRELPLVSCPYNGGKLSSSYYGEAGRMPVTHWFEALFGAGCIPAKVVTRLVSRGAAPKSLGCISLSSPRPQLVELTEWSACKQKVVVENFTVTAGIKLTSDKVLYVSLTGVNMFHTIPLEQLIEELFGLLSTVRLYMPGA